MTNSTGIRNSNSTERAAAERGRLRRFGVIVGVAFLVLATILLWRGKPAWPYLGGVGALLGLSGLLVPAWLRPVERIWMIGARAMGWVMTRVILGIVFAIVFTPAGLILRALRKDPLGMKFPSRATTYWNDRSMMIAEREQMERMF